MLPALPSFSVLAWMQIMVPISLKLVKHVHLPFKGSSSSWKTFPQCKLFKSFKSEFLITSAPHAIPDEDEENLQPYLACWGCSSLCQCSQKAQGCCWGWGEGERNWTPSSFYCQTGTGCLWTTQQRNRHFFLSSCTSRGGGTGAATCRGQPRGCSPGWAAAGLANQTGSTGSNGDPAGAPFWKEHCYSTEMTFGAQMSSFKMKQNQSSLLFRQKQISCYCCTALNTLWWSSTLLSVCLVREYTVLP